MSSSAAVVPLSAEEQVQTPVAAQTTCAWCKDPGMKWCVECTQFQCDEHVIEAHSHFQRMAEIAVKNGRQPPPDHRTVPADEYLMLQAATEPAKQDFESEASHVLIQVSPTEHRLIKGLRWHMLGTSASHSRPSLVGCVGPSGVGKSLLIKLLIDQDEANSPVPAKVGQAHSTSTDLHLYNHRASSNTQAPLLFVDSEGLFGADVTEGTKGLTRTRLQRAADYMGVGESLEEMEERYKALRLWHVHKTHPRLLYLFCDVLVFVHTMMPQRGNLIPQLLEWGRSAVTGSSGIVRKPKLLLVFNKQENWRTPKGEDLLDSEVATRHFFNGFEVEKADLERFYHDVTVVVVPTLSGGSNAIEMKKQHSLLQTHINSGVEGARQQRKACNMLFTTDVLKNYLYRAMERFNLNKPGQPPVSFNLLHLQQEMRPPTPLLTGAMINYFFALMQWRRAKISADSGVDDTQCFCETIAAFSDRLAGAWLLSLARQQAAQPVGDGASPDEEWVERFAALNAELFKDMPCAATKDFVQDDADKLTARCGLTKQAHVGMDQHQSSCTVKRKAVNSSWWKFWESDHTYSPAWWPAEEGYFAPSKLPVSDLAQWPEGFLRGLKALPTDQKLRDMHRQGLLLRPEDLKMPSLNLCICCLLELAPTERRPCGHILCASCMNESLRTETGDRKCPLCDQPAPWRAPHQQLPELAGYRVLTLDGGGIRGIAELKVLQLVEQRLGVPVQSLFDLVVGTSAGGIVASALGVEGKSVDECLDLVSDMAKAAFVPTQGYGLLSKIPLLGGFLARLTLLASTKYQAEPLAKFLRSKFSKAASPMRLSTCDGERQLPLVAVTTCSLRPDAAHPHDRIAARLFTSYNRVRIDSKSHSDPLVADLDVTVLDACMSTSAAGTYFPPWSIDRGNMLFTDGGMRNNNPARIALAEASLLWDAADTRQCDVLVSLGTGVCPANSDGAAQKDYDVLKLVDDVVHISTDTETTWRHDVEPKLGERAVRLNPTFSQAIELDDTRKVDVMLRETTAWLKGNGSHALTDACNRLVAALLYVSSKDGEWTLRCRSKIPHDSPVADFFRRWSSSSVPLLTVKVTHSDSKEHSGCTAVVEFPSAGEWWKNMNRDWSVPLRIEGLPPKKDDLRAELLMIAFDTPINVVNPHRLSISGRPFALV